MAHAFYLRILRVLGYILTLVFLPIILLIIHQAFFWNRVLTNRRL